MKEFLAKNRYSLLLVLIGLLVFWVAYGCMQIEDQTYRFPDSGNYAEAAANFYHNLQPHHFRPLGMAIIYGLPYLFGTSEESIFTFSIYINLIFWLGSAQLIFSLFRNFLKPRIAFFAALVFYLLPGILFNSFTLLTECIYIFLVLLSFYFISKYYSLQSYKYLAWAIAVLLFTMLIKPGAKFFSIIIIICFIRVILKNLPKPANLLIVASLVFIMVQCAMIKRYYGDFTITYIDGVTYYNYLGAEAELFKEGKTFDARENLRAEYLTHFSYHVQKQMASNDMASQIKDNKVNLLRAYAGNVCRNSVLGSPAVSICTPINLDNFFYVRVLHFISRCQNLFFSLTGLFIAVYYLFKSYNSKSLYTLMALFILYTITLSGISSYEGDRFHIVFYPFALILLAKFYAERSTSKKTVV